MENMHYIDTKTQFCEWFGWKVGAFYRLLALKMLMESIYANEVDLRYLKYSETTSMGWKTWVQTQKKQLFEWFDWKIGAFYIFLAIIMLIYAHLCRWFGFVEFLNKLKQMPPNGNLDKNTKIRFLKSVSKSPKCDEITSAFVTKTRLLCRNCQCRNHWHPT